MDRALIAPHRLFMSNQQKCVYKSGLVGLVESKFPYPMIVAARKIAGAEPNAILSSLSYLGEMTYEEFGKPDAPRVG
ncbi:hypothetical protein C0058_08920 [Pseudomonas sp. NC02]|nr:hypothetical protein C0058_08920 [Pseudomonas sp. NC02]